MSASSDAAIASDLPVGSTDGLGGKAIAKNFKNLSEQEILALVPDRAGV